MHSALRQAVRYQLIDLNPTDNVSLPRNRRKEMMAMTRDQVSRFLKAAENDMYFEVFYFAIASGMRPGEYLALKWKDIDWERCDARSSNCLLARHKVGNGGAKDSLEPPTGEDAGASNAATPELPKQPC